MYVQTRGSTTPLAAAFAPACAAIAQACDSQDDTRRLRDAYHLNIRAEYGPVRDALTFATAKSKPQVFEIGFHGRRAGYLFDIDGTWLFSATNEDGALYNSKLAELLCHIAQAYAQNAPMAEDDRDLLHIWYAACAHNANIRSQAFFAQDTK